MSAPSANPAGVFPIVDATSVPVPTQSDQDMSEVHGPVVRAADLRTGIASSPLWSPTSIAPDDGEPSASGSRRYDPTGTYGPLLLQQNNLANMAVVHQHGLPLETIGYAESRHRQILDNTQQRHMEHLQEVHAENYNEVQQMRIALAITQSEFSRLESSAAGVTNAQARVSIAEESVSVARQKLAYAEQHAMNSEQQIHLMQQEVIAHNNERARIAEQSRQAEVAARQANGLQEDKIKILSNQMQELIVRLDNESRHRARLEAENADLRARTELPVRPMHIGTLPGLPDTSRESTDGDSPFMPPLPPEGVVSLPSSHVDPHQDRGPPGGEPPKGPHDDDGGDDNDSDDDHRRRKDDKKKKKKRDKRRKKSRGRRRRRSPSSSPASSSSSRRSSSSSSSSTSSSPSSLGGKLDKKAVRKLIKAITGAASSSKDEHDSDKPRVKEQKRSCSLHSLTLRTIAIGD